MGNNNVGVKFITGTARLTNNGNARNSRVTNGNGYRSNNTNAIVRGKVIRGFNKNTLPNGQEGICNQTRVTAQSCGEQGTRQNNGNGQNEVRQNGSVEVFTVPGQ